MMILSMFLAKLYDDSSKYSRQDWESAFVLYQQIIERIDQYKYTDEELKEIGKLKARCLKQMTKGIFKQFQVEIYNEFKQIEDTLEKIDIEDVDIESLMGPLMG